MANQEKGTVSKPDVNPLNRFMDVRRELDDEASHSSTSTQEWIAGKLGALLTANSVEEINSLMTSTGLTSADALVGRTLEIQDLSLLESAEAFREKSALQKFVIVKAVDTDSGEQFVIDGGGDQFVAGLIRMRDLFGFPFTGTLLAATTSAGYQMHYWRFQTPRR